MSVIDQIKAPIKIEMKTFEEKFKVSMKSNVPLLDKITHYIIRRKGKQIRPMFVFLSSKMFGPIQDSAYTAASLIELLHTATLVHDDVVDDAHLRRGFFSANALWKNKMAVLVGDYLLSKGLLLSIDNQEFKLLQVVSNAVKEMSEGELLQMEKARKLDISEEIYFEIIQKKTAVLIASCCASGGIAMKQDEKTVQRLWEMGNKIGIAFQIKDDLFDFGADTSIGKPTGIDIQERKMTLPLIHALKMASKADKKRIIKMIRRDNNDARKVKEVIDFVNNSEGIAYATEKMHTYKNQALEILEEFPEGEAKTQLKSLVDYTINRKK